MMAEIKEGSVVKLAADGYHDPHMTVGKINDGRAECIWFVGNELRQAHIPVSALKYLRE